jgi:hypothetical protein
MIDYDFIEIGTSDFDTLIEACSNSEVGLCVEPIKEYLDNLPFKENVKKINCAISFDNSESEAEVFYIPAEVLKEHNLPLGLRGCNRINEYHPHHVTRGITHLVQTYKIKQISIATLLIDNKVKGINHLKIDTEGGDCYILKNLFLYLKDKDKEFYPKMITFETNLLTKKELIEETIVLLEEKGYKIKSKNDFVEDGNTVLELQ